MQEVTKIVILTTSHAMAKFLANDKILCSSLTTKGQWQSYFQLFATVIIILIITFFAAGPLWTMIQGEDLCLKKLTIHRTSCWWVCFCTVNSAFGNQFPLFTVPWVWKSDCFPVLHSCWCPEIRLLSCSPQLIVSGNQTAFLSSTILCVWKSDRFPVLNSQVHLAIRL